MSFYETHKSIIDNAIKAIHDRAFYAQYPEHPSPKIYGETADEDGRNKFQEGVGKKFEELLQEAPDSWVGDEESPYMQEPLGITYPAFSTSTLVERGGEQFKGMEENFS